VKRIISLVALLAGSCVGSVDNPPGARPPELTESIRELVAGELYSCGGNSFTASALEGPKGARAEDHPANRKFNRLLRRNNPYTPNPGTGWRRVYLSDSHAEFVAEWPEGRYQFVELNRKSDGWQWSGSGDCKPLAETDRAHGGSFTLPDDDAPSPFDTAIRLLVDELNCHGFDVPPAEDIHPEIIYGNENVIVIIRIDSPKGWATCPRPPPFPYTLELKEPLGERALVDGAEYPPKTVLEGY
jgi:hypothetical protein